MLLEYWNAFFIEDPSWPLNQTSPALNISLSVRKLVTLNLFFIIGNRKYQRVTNLLNMVDVRPSVIHIHWLQPLYQGTLELEKHTCCQLSTPPSLIFNEDDSEGQHNIFSYLMPYFQIAHMQSTLSSQQMELANFLADVT